jgi:hypothetical protein
MHKIAKILILIWSIFCAIGLIVGLVNVAGLKTSGEYEQAGAAIGTALGIGFWVALWFFPTAGLALIALITRPRERMQFLEKPKLCANCGKYYTGSPVHCPNCGRKLASSGGTL